MKLFRYIITGLGLAAVLALAVSGSACGFVKKVIAKDKLNQGALAYNAGRTAEAARYFEDTTKLVPDEPRAWLYLGATLRKQYQATIGPEREAKIRQTLEVYNKALGLANNCQLKDNAMGYISEIYKDLAGGEPDSAKKKEYDDKHREWLLNRANSECATTKDKATIYHSIAIGYWDCAYTQSTRYADKAKAQDPFHCRNFYYAPDKQKFDECLAKGLEFNSKALSIDPDYTDAWSYKSLLYREKQKSTCNDADRKAAEAEAKKAADRAIELTKQKQTQAPQG